MFYDPTADGSSCDLFTCTICLEPYDDLQRLPKLLACHHSFCQSCITVLSSGSQQKMLVCPSCREKTVLPPGGVSKLQTNFYVSQMKEVINRRGDKVQSSCPKHSKPLDLFCNRCEQSICKGCQQEDHSGHPVSPAEEALASQRQLMQAEIASSWKLVMATKKIQDAAESEVRFLLASKRCAEENLHTTFGLIEEALRQRKTELQMELNEAYESRNEVVLSRLENANSVSTALGGLIETCQQIMASETIDNLVAHRIKLVSKTQAMQNDDKLSRHSQVNSLSFSSENTENFINSLKSFGSLIIENPIPSSAVVKECEAVACMTSTVNFVITSCNNEELKCHYPLKVEVTDLYSDVIPSSVQHTTNGQYQVTFCPQISGLHHIAITYWHYMIASCVIMVQSNDPVLVFGKAVCKQKQEELQYPRDVAVDNSTGNIYIADSGNGRILKYDNRGTLLLELPISDADEDYSSCGLAVDQQRGVMVCSEVLFNGSDPVEARSILKYSPDGKLLSHVSLHDVLSKGLSLAINSLGQTIIADFEQDAIFVFDAQGRFLKRFGETGSSPSQFRRPTFVCIGRDDSIIVTDSDNNRIQVFDKTGRFSYGFGERGTRKGQFSLPFGVTADRFGNILVVDGANNRIQIFGYGGKFVGCIESLGDRMNAPRGIDVTRDGHVLVADRDNHCIKKYKYL